MAEKEGASASAPVAAAAGSGSGDGEPQSVVLKVAMLGEMEVGKTSLMVKYVEGTFDQDYIQTLGARCVLALCCGCGACVAK